MSGDDVVIRTKLAPPRQSRRILPRPALLARLREALDYRLTLVQAGTGHGKTTSLTMLAASDIPVFWYSLGEEDTEPQRYLSYLVAAFRHGLRGLSDAPQVALEEAGRESTREGWYHVVDVLVNALAEALPPDPAILVVDDYHFVAHSADVNAVAERFITYMPPSLRVIVATRYGMTSPALVKWRARGELLDIGRDDLAFSAAEIDQLFSDVYGLRLTPVEVDLLARKTEGWPIALQLVGQGLRGRRGGVADLLGEGRSPAGLFEFLAHEVYDNQPPDVADFLRGASVLRELTPAACDAVMGVPGSALFLDRLQDLDLFVVPLGGRHVRYQSLFHDFLRQLDQDDPAARRERHRRAADFFHAQGDLEEAIYHWIEARAWRDAASAVEAVGDSVLRGGRLDTVARWIDALPPAILADHPALQAYLGDIARLQSRFDHALGWYAQAERAWRGRGDMAGVARALRGQARVYLDQVRPAQAESLLQEALRLTDGGADRQARARMLELLAENKLNMGKPLEAEALRAEARALVDETPDEDALSVRVKLRTGRLDEAQRILEAWAEAERRDTRAGHTHAPRAHRETLLLLALTHAFRGEAEPAFQRGLEAVALGEQLGSPFVTAVAHLRLGHAWQLRSARGGLAAQSAGPADTRRAYEEAIRCYQTSISIGDRLAVRRTRAEAMWGLTRASGNLGDLDSARRAWSEGVEIARWAGDPWLAALIELTLGASLVLAGDPEPAVDVLQRVLTACHECGDSFGCAATRLWLSLAYHDQRQTERCVAALRDALALCETHGYDFLFKMPSLLGPPDPRRLAPLLILARSLRPHAVYATRLLIEIGLPQIETHPGYTLRVQTLGAFRVWRGAVEVQPREWQRDKARQLFQLLLTERGRWLQRDEIVERLWPSLPPEAAGRDFKVALNAVYKALEPARVADAPSAYIVREGAAYRLRPEADVWLDADVFERAYGAGLRGLGAGDAGDEAIARLDEALQLYEGDYLPDALYEDWSSEARERLLGLYLRGVDRLAEALIERGRYDEGLAACQRLLARDPCWERAYRLMMIAHARQGNPPLAVRVYQRCAVALRDELGVGPSPATVALVQEITGGAAATSA